MKEDINMSKKLYGYVSKDNLEYQWKSEPTACEVCKSMNGKIFIEKDVITIGIQIL